MKPENYKYHLAIRLKEYDYSSPGIYFVTICTKGKCRLFGRVENGLVILSEFGLMARACWNNIQVHFPNASLLDFVIMPDHLHGLICLTDNGKGTACRASAGENQYAESFGKPVKGSIPTIIRSYKSAVTKIVNQDKSMKRSAIWQPGYYEHVVRNDEELNYTINYIRSNPLSWERKDIL
jgi:REP element-mobilizing transposase RayT